ncbi:MAG: zinc-ribbon domain-containing protein, partial [Candidatus Methylomirabilales bacterium]
VLHSQLWDIVQRSKLEQEVFAHVESSLAAHGGVALQTAGGPGSGSWGRVRFCTECGAQLPPPGKFCAECGAEMI